jgi:hypothetical protein
LSKFNLSEKIEENGEHLREPYEVVPKEDVKKFIRLLKEDIVVPKDCDAGIALREMIKRIDKL